MQPKPTVPPAGVELRRRAEERLREQHLETGPHRSEADTQRLIHELQVHQIELEMQNEELQKSRDEVESGLDKYSDLFDFAPVGYFTLDREGTIQEVNLTGATLLGIERSRLLQRRLGGCVAAPGQPAFNAFLKKVFDTKARESCEVTLLKEGKPPIEVRMEAVAAAAGRECRVVIEDLTELRRAEQERLILNKLESTGILAGGLAHDFNNLLTVILLDLELAQVLAPPGAELANLLEEAKQAAVTSRSLTQQLITFAKGGALVRKPARIGALIQESVPPVLSGSRVRCDLALAQDLWLAEVDEGQIGQVIRNLVLNAREAMPDGGLISIRAENVVLKSPDVSALPPGEYLHVSIADQGVGMAKEMLPNIFDPYFSTKQRGNQKGMGLGLTICHTVMQKHGGAITVKSAPGVGTTFHLHLPACRKPLPLAEAAAPPLLPRPGKILVMDDEEGLRMVVGKAIQRLGHEVALVADGQQAIEFYGRAQRLGQPFGVVFLDLTVRCGLGGTEAIQALLELDPAVKAIVMSGYADDPVITEPERYGFKGSLAKPFTTKTLQETLARVMTSDP